MPIAEPRLYQSAKLFLARQQLDVDEIEEQYCTKFTVRSGAVNATLSIYNSGAIVVGGRDSQLKGLLLQFKDAAENGQAIPGRALPFEIDKFPETIVERVPACDPVIVRFVREAIDCLRADALLGAAFMLGAASERAISLLMQAYVDGIKEEQNRLRFITRTNNKMISARYDEFLRSFKSSKNRPTDGLLAHDLEIIIGGVFQFCRITRNEVGHPQIVPDLDKGVLLANLGHFVTYIERIYQLMDHFSSNGVEL
jgi:hypothetical protein